MTGDAKTNGKKMGDFVVGQVRLTLQLSGPRP